ncbi:hypothetical protein KJS94_07615 [Flavihumibacter rivuli]|uniref:hypothetical protein n=1 Tax=Flavihumibacter rivuli TaxID=2838156 RepID=UPI001BDE442A|nr:hypothetical protein [Flavihumibacter rivuli]ULQ58068.1 hypothetical protein KJS94_07615 [Flavihumibacter rivuli]
MSDQLRNRMHQWEATPPAAVWPAISRELDEQQAEMQLQSRLSAMEELPPAQCWGKIALELEPQRSIETTPRKDLVPVRPLYPYLIRYAGAAAVAGLALWLFFEKPFNSKPDDITTAIVPTLVAPTPEGNTGDSGTMDTKPPAMVQAISSLDITPGLKGTRLQEASKSNRDPIYSLPDYKANLRESTTAIQTDIPVKVVPARPSKLTQDTPARYISIMLADGTPLKVSTKLAPYYDRLLADSKQESNEEDVVSQQVRKLKKKLSDISLAPGPYNFFEMVAMIELMNKD